MNHEHHDHAAMQHEQHNHAHHDMSDHSKHAGHSPEMFRSKFWLSLALSIPVFLYSPMIQIWLRFTPPNFPGSELVPLIFGSIIFFYGGIVFVKSALMELRMKQPGMMTLISLAIITAYLYSIATQFFVAGETFYWELASLIVIMLLGHWLEMASVMRASNALDDLAKLLPDQAEKLVRGKPTTVSLSELKVGDLVLVRPGANIPVDGVITDGESAINEAAVSGESSPVTKTTGDNVIAGTNNQDGALTIKVTKLGDDTTLAGIMRLVADAQNSKSRVQVLADKAAFVLTIVAVASAIITAIVWLIVGSPSQALERGVTVLIIACPHALGLAIPLVVAISTSLSAKNGLLVRNRQALESARQLDWVLFDKTGTLTRGEHEVTNVWSAKGFHDRDILRLAASLEQPSEHIVGRGIVRRAESDKLKLQKVGKFSALPGLGVRGTIEKIEYLAVGLRYVETEKISIPAELKKQVSSAGEAGESQVYLLKKDKVIGIIALADTVRDESKQAIDDLHKLGIKTAMVTGDTAAVAESVASQLGIDHVFADVKPEDKDSKVSELQHGGARVAMVGDGINDAPALARADIGIAIGAGTDVAIKSADIVLIDSDPRDVTRVINLSKTTYRKMLQNLAWATGYNVIAIPLAAGVLAPIGFVMPPALGAVVMSLSTIIVAANAQLLRRTKL